MICSYNNSDKNLRFCEDVNLLKHEASGAVMWKLNSGQRSQEAGDKHEANISPH